MAADSEDDRKLDFEKEKFVEELAIKREELDLKKAEAKRQSLFWNQVSPVAVALFAAFIGLTGNLVVTFIQGQNSRYRDPKIASSDDSGGHQNR